MLEHVLINSVNDAEKCINPWLTFDEESMKQIGLQKLSVALKCNLGSNDRSIEIAENVLEDGLEQIDRLNSLSEEMTADLIRKRVDKWNNGDQRCTAIADVKNRLYTTYLTSTVLKMK